MNDPVVLTKGFVFLVMGTIALTGGIGVAALIVLEWHVRRIAGLENAFEKHLSEGHR